MLHTYAESACSTVTPSIQFVVYLLLVLILYPYVNEGSFGDFVFRVIGGFGILLTVYAISLRRTLLIFGILLAIPAILQRALLTDGQTYTGWRF